MNDKKITAVGEILWDIYSDKKRLGGAPFNFIYHVWKLNGNANFISSVGNDENGKELLNHLNSIGFNTKHISEDNEHSTGTVNVSIDENKIPRFRPSSNCSFDYLQISSNANKVLLHETDLLYFGTFTTRGEVSKKAVLALLNNPDRKYFSDLNLRHNFYSKEFIEKTLNVCSLVKVNEEELEILIRLFSLSKNHDCAVKELMSIYKIEMTALTLGERGAKIFSGSEISYCQAGGKEVVDTLGAGDAYAAILALGYLSKIDIEKINKLANDFAYDICCIEGGTPIGYEIYEKYKF